jgi:hypothetical protein
MKKIFLLLFAGIVLLMSGNLFSQSCELYFQMKEGSTMKIANFNSKSKLSGTTEIIINERKEIAGGVSIQMTQNYKDIKENSYSSELLVECINDIIYLDMVDFLSPDAMVAYEGMEMEISADRLPFPSNAKPGDQLEDGVISMLVRNEGVNILNIVVQVYERKVVSEEIIETPAGPFSCLKIKYNMLSQFGFVKLNMSVVEWFNKDFGTVRSESYNKKGKLTGYTELQEIN